MVEEDARLLESSESESQVLPPRSVFTRVSCSWLKTCLPLESFPSACLTLFASTLSSTLILMPVAYGAVGLIGGTVTLFIGLLLQLFTSSCLLLIAEKRGQFTLDELFADIFATNGRLKVLYHIGLRVTEAVILLFNYSLIVYHLLIIQGATFILLERVGSDYKTLWLTAVGAAWIVLIFSFSQFEAVPTLRYFSLLSFLSMVYVAIEIYIESATKLNFRVDTGFEAVIGGEWLSLAIVLLAFCCHTNLCSIYKEMSNRRRRGGWMLNTTYAVVFLISLSFGLFGSLVDDELYILDWENLKKKSPLVFGFCAVGLTLTVNTPLLIFPTLDVFFRAYTRTRYRDAPALVKGAVVAFILISSASLVEYCILNLKTLAALCLAAFALVTSTYISLVLPCVLFLNATSEKEESVRRGGCWSVLSLVTALWISGLYTMNQELNYLWHNSQSS